MKDSNDVPNIIKALIEVYGPRCDDFDADCPTCQAWAELQRLQDSHLYSFLRAHNNDSAEPVACVGEGEADLVAGWNACRKSIYAICEDMQEKPFATMEKNGPHRGLGPTAYQEAHQRGFNAGWAYAAKSISRGFNSLEAMDDDNLKQALTARYSLASPPAKEVTEALQAAKELADVMEGLSGGRSDDEWIWAAQEKINAAVALTNRTPNDEVGNG